MSHQSSLARRARPEVAREMIRFRQSGEIAPGRRDVACGRAERRRIAGGFFAGRRMTCPFRRTSAANKLRLNLTIFCCHISQLALIDGLFRPWRPGQCPARLDLSIPAAKGNALSPKRAIATSPRYTGEAKATLESRPSLKANAGYWIERPTPARLAPLCPTVPAVAQCRRPQSLIGADWPLEPARKRSSLPILFSSQRVQP